MAGLRDDAAHLLRVAQQRHVALMDLAGRDSLTPVQYAVLLALTTAPGVDQRTVGELASLDKSTVGDVVSRLVRRGLVRRHRDPADGRRKLLHVTDDARRTVRAEVEHLKEIDARFLAPLPPPERHRLLRRLRAIAFADRVDPSTTMTGGDPAGISIDEIAWAFGRLVRICHQTHTAYWAEETGRRVTPVQYSVLGAMRGRDGIDQRTLGELVALDKATNADLVARMCERDLLRRTRDAGDARRYALRLTEAGAAVRAQVQPGADRALARLLAPLGDGERAEFLAAMRAVTSADAG
ncbi:MarR family winged helix-turn-helix transcriptional regulator [Pseudonocardia acaciae]|uniref:MarR family winged helix-turn-helix transcriptional regulator n=1 Tax=Pseudonocardia acaciae TaxID=551276 RepID=UPI00068866B7|nr:MarR family winged helix-turn-helix transcriptional regulator [Pseudonocardia acaciae]